MTEPILRGERFEIRYVPPFVAWNDWLARVAQRTRNRIRPPSFLLNNFLYGGIIMPFRLGQIPWGLIHSANSRQDSRALPEGLDN